MGHLPCSVTIRLGTRCHQWFFKYLRLSCGRIYSRFDRLSSKSVWRSFGCSTMTGHPAGESRLVAMRAILEARSHAKPGTDSRSGATARAPENGHGVEGITRCRRPWGMRLRASRRSGKRCEGGKKIRKESRPATKDNRARPNHTSPRPPGRPNGADASFSDPWKRRELAALE